MAKSNKHKFISDPQTWFAAGSILVVGLLLAVRYLCTDPRVRLFTSIFTFVYLWSAFLHEVFMFIKSRHKFARGHIILAVISVTLMAAFLIWLTILAIGRGGVF